MQITASNVSKLGVISGLYFPVFGPNTGKYGPEIIPYLDTFHAVRYCKNASAQYGFFRGKNYKYFIGYKNNDDKLKS